MEQAENHRHRQRVADHLRQLPEAAAQAVGKSHEGEQPYRHPVQVGEHLRKGNTQRHTAEHHRRHVSAQEAIQAAERFQIRSPLF